MWTFGRKPSPSPRRASAKKTPITALRFAVLVAALLASVFADWAGGLLRSLAQANAPQAESAALPIHITLSEAQSLTPESRIVLHLSRELSAAEGRLAMIIKQADVGQADVGQADARQTDVTPLFAVSKTTLTYNAALLPLPVGESQLTVYLVTKNEAWRELARFALRVRLPNEPPTTAGTTAPTTTTRAATSNGGVGVDAVAAQTTTIEKAPPTTTAEKATPAPTTTPTTAPATASTTTVAPPPTTAPADAGSTNVGGQSEATAKPGGFEKLDLTPSLTIGFKSQAAEAHFPDSARPPRPTFADLTLQGSVRSEAARGVFTSQNQFDIAGSSFRQEALRFGQLGDAAPLVDLSSYLMQFQVSDAKFLVGHTAYGNNRLLVNGFSSRGVTVTVPLPPRFDLSLAAMNGASIVGIDNFFGLGRRKHQLLSGTLGAELIGKRPGGARLEVSYLNGYVQALNGFTQGAVNDVERSIGAGFRFVVSDAAQRFRFDGGVARSRFVNPADPLLEQGRAVVAIPVVARNARYLESGFDILKDVALTANRRATLTVNYRHETVDPLYRSLGAATQADKTQNQFEVIASLGDINAQLSHLRFNDNLNNVPSILKSLSRVNRLALAAPLVSLFGDANKPSARQAWLPRLAYSLDRLHQFGAALPVNGGFEFAPEAIPDFLATNQNFSADWQAGNLRLGYRLNQSLQNNRQRGREQADLSNLAQQISTGLPVTAALDLTVDLNIERARNRESQRLDRTYRAATTINWRLPGRHLLAVNLAHTLAGDAAQTSRNRNLEFDLQWSYQFTVGKQKFRKLQGQTFIRYADRYAKAFDSLFGLNNRTRFRTLNVGLNITAF